MSTQRNDGRPRRFRVSSQTLTRALIVSALDRPNVKRYARVVHDRDPDAKTRAHVVFEPFDGRTLKSVADIGPNRRFASPAGVNPISATSGNTVRHRINRSGDHRLNRALHMTVATRMRMDSRTCT